MQAPHPRFAFEILANFYFFDFKGIRDKKLIEVMHQYLPYWEKTAELKYARFLRSQVVDLE